MHPLKHLGAQTAYPTRYAPELLEAIPRARGRSQIASLPPFFGVDLWTAYELGWLGPDGRPHVGAATLAIPCDSPNIVESKSLKLYLFSLNDAVFEGPEALAAQIVSDLSACVEAPVALTWCQEGAPGSMRAPGDCIDGAPWRSPQGGPDPASLAPPGPEDRAVLHSHLLRSLCPVTAQPDWATLVVDYAGPRIDPGGLLAYVASFRSHQGFHEQCVEQIYADLMGRYAPRTLVVWARYTRRGGLDINPLRSTQGAWPAMERLWRQ